MSNETDRYLEVVARLKKKLLNYYKNKEQKYKPVLLEQIKDSDPGQDLLANGIEWFIYCYRFKNGDTFIDRFIKGRQDLSELEKDILKGWKKSFEGVFMIKSVDNSAAVLANLFDNMDYTVASDLGGDALNDLRPGYYIATRLIPLHDIYLFSGIQYLFPPEEKDNVWEMCGKALEANPRLSMGAQRGKWQRLSNEFLSHFGADIIVVPGKELDQTINGFIDLFYADDGKKPSIDFPEDLVGSETVGVIMDETEGLNFYPEFHLFAAPFKDPELLADQRHRDAIIGYLQSDAISTLPFRKVKERYPRNFRKLFAELFNKKNRDNEKDFNVLMAAKESLGRTQ